MTALALPIVQPGRGALPVLLSVPHSGRDYPSWLVALANGGRESLVALEDPLVDRLVWRAARRGIGTVIARAPRAAIDCNRAEDEIDPSVVSGAAPRRLTARARGGLGIVPGRTQQHGNLWRRPITSAELGERIVSAHRPFHDAIAAALAALHDRFGCAVLIDCHSMPPPALGVAPIILGDCYGRSSARWLSESALRLIRTNGFAASLNAPFAGGHVTERHGRPAHNIHALQLEIDRRLYLDPSFARAGPEFDRVATLIDTLAVGLGEDLLARRFATAAE